MTRSSSRRKRQRIAYPYNEDEDEDEIKKESESFFVPLIEEFLPNDKQTRDHFAPPNPYSNATRNRYGTTPTIAVKTEEAAVADLYGATPKINRQRSKSTAQLTTPTSSLDGNNYRSTSTDLPPRVKVEFDHIEIGSWYATGVRCTPPNSSPEKAMSPGQKTVPKVHEISRSRSGSRSINNGPRKRRTSETNGAVDGKLQKDCIPQNLNAENNTAGAVTKGFEKSHSPNFSIILPPPKSYQLAAMKANVVKPPQLETQLKGPLPATSRARTKITLNQPISPAGRGTNPYLCCKLMCVKCTPKELWEEYGLGPPEARPHTPRMKSLSLCPTVSSFALDDDIPSPAEMCTEARKIVQNSTQHVVSTRLKRLRRTSPCFAKTRLSLHSDAGDLNTGLRRDSKSICIDCEDEGVPQKIPSRILRHTEKDAALAWELKGKRPLRGLEIDQLVSNWDEIRPHSHGSTALPLLYKPKIHKDLRAVDNEVDLRDGNSSEEESSDDSSDSDYDYDSTHDHGRHKEKESIKKGSAQEKLVTPAIDQWQSSGFDEETVLSDDVVEIDKGDFERSGIKRRIQKGYRQEWCSKTCPVIPASKSEYENEIDTGLNGDTGACLANAYETPDTNADITPCSQPALPPLSSCSEILHDYFTHGTSTPGNFLASAGFVRYDNFKTYCSTNNLTPEPSEFVKFRKDLRHFLTCAHHKSQQPGLFQSAWLLENNKGFSYKSCSNNVEKRRREDEAVGNEIVPRAGRDMGSRGETTERDFVNELEDQLRAQAETIKTLTEGNKKLQRELKSRSRSRPRRRPSSRT